MRRRLAPMTLIRSNPSPQTNRNPPHLPKPPPVAGHCLGQEMVRCHCRQAGRKQVHGRFYEGPQHFTHNYHILHKDTGSDIIKAGHPKYLYGPKNKLQTDLPAWAQHPAEARVDVFRGPQTALSEGHSLPKHIKDLGNSPFALYNHKKVGIDKDRPFQEGAMPYPGGKQISKFPVLEHDKTNLGSDCHAHIWSFKPKILGQSRSGWGANERESDRHHVTIPVSIKKDKCNSDGHCEIEASSDMEIGGQFCSGSADRGAPVLCGKEQKLTYLLAPHSHSTFAECGPTASGYHVGHLIPHINAHDSRLVSMQTGSG